MVAVADNSATAIAVSATEILRIFSSSKDRQMPMLAERGACRRNAQYCDKQGRFAARP
jgi:hypothetical protein